MHCVVVKCLSCLPCALCALQERRARHSSRLCKSSSAVSLADSAAPKQTASTTVTQRKQLLMTEQRSAHSAVDLTTDAMQQVQLYLHCTRQKRSMLA
jgi:hypothetical protein